MQKMKKILAPTDLSELSQVGVRYALTFAQSQGAEVILYYVIGYEETMPYRPGPEDWLADRRDRSPIHELVEKHRELLAKFLSENFADLISGLSIRQEVHMGVPFKKILEKANEEAVDMIIMSTHGRTGIPHLFIGSVTEQVVRRASCPVLSIRPPA